MSIAPLSYAILFLLGGSMLAGMAAALRQLGRLKAKEVLKKLPRLFFFYRFLKPVFGKSRWEGLFLSFNLGKLLLALAFAISAFMALQSALPFWGTVIGTLALFLVCDLITRVFAAFAPLIALKICAPLSSCLLTLVLPLSALVSKLILSSSAQGAQIRSTEDSIRDKILEILDESELSARLDPQERKLILSVANFKQRCVREVMVPRIDVVAIEEVATLSETIQLFLQQRYSRLPVYQDNIDHVIGVLLYKDALSAYMKAPSTPLKQLLKPVLYTPETKKIAALLQEFRSKQIHLAIVVDEYGGTEGMITIEDILEELVGEIADEDDTDQEILFAPLPAGGWVVDARMTISDIEKELSVVIPPSPEYDTLGGYIYHKAGAIPSRGWRLHHDAFDLEILSSDERSIEKVRVVTKI